MASPVAKTIMKHLPTVKGASTEAKKAHMLRALEEAGGVVAKACNTVGIPRSTFYKWISDDDDFKTDWFMLRECMVDDAEEGLMGLVRGGDIKAILFVLETLGKDRGYSKRQEIVDPTKRAASSSAKTHALQNLEKVLDDRELEQLASITTKLSGSAN